MKKTRGPLQICLLAALLLLAFTAKLKAQFTYATTNGTVTITGYTGSASSISIPDTINNLPVTSIGSGALENGTFTSLTIPNSVTNIGGFAFYGCASLASVSIGTNVISIGQAAFYNCTSLHGVTIPPSVATIGSDAFTYCGLTSISIPNSVTNVDGFAFYGCTSLTNITFGTNVAVIGQAAFYGCSSLRSASIPSRVTSIAGETFENCVSLTNVTIGANVTSIGVGAFTYCGLTAITIPDGVTSIANSTFYGCSNLTSVIIGPNVTFIDQAAFYSCTNLQGLYFKGDMPTNASPYAFLYDPNATVYYLPGTAGWSNSFDGLPTAFWTLPYPIILNNRPSFGVQANQFGFTVSWATNKPIIIQACTNFTKPVWLPVQTNTLAAGVSYFNDPQWTNSPVRFYRISSP